MDSLCLYEPGWHFTSTAVAHREHGLPQNDGTWVARETGQCSAVPAAPHLLPAARGAQCCCPRSATAGCEAPPPLAAVPAAPASGRLQGGGVGAIDGLLADQPVWRHHRGNVKTGRRDCCTPYARVSQAINNSLRIPCKQGSNANDECAAANNRYLSGSLKAIDKSMVSFFSPLHACNFLHHKHRKKARRERCCQEPLCSASCCLQSARNFLGTGIVKGAQ